MAIIDTTKFVDHPKPKWVILPYPVTWGLRLMADSKDISVHHIDAASTVKGPLGFLVGNTYKHDPRKFHTFCRNHPDLRRMNIDFGFAVRWNKYDDAYAIWTKLKDAETPDIVKDFKFTHGYVDAHKAYMSKYRS